jgi:hypothetical protein
MADNQNHLANFQFPTRNIIITGERVARMTSTTVRVSRLEQQFLNMSMSTAPKVRDTVSRVSDRYNQAFARFEAELKEIESDLASDNRGDKRGRQSNQPDRNKSRPAVSRDQSSRDPKAGALSPSASSQGKQASGKDQQAGNPNPGSGQKPKGQQQKSAAPDSGVQKPAPTAQVATAPQVTQSHGAEPEHAPVLVPAAAEPVAAPASLNSL